jgi:hypothetical protein
MSAALGGRNAPEMAVNVAPVITRLQPERVLALHRITLLGHVAMRDNAEQGTGAITGFAFRRIRLPDGQQDHASVDHAHRGRGAAMIIAYKKTEAATATAQPDKNIATLTIGASLRMNGIALNAGAPQGMNAMAMPACSSAQVARGIPIVELAKCAAQELA